METHVFQSPDEDLEPSASATARYLRTGTTKVYVHAKNASGEDVTCEVYRQDVVDLDTTPAIDFIIAKIRHAAARHPKPQFQAV